MLVRETMTRQVNLANPNMSLQEAAQKMRDGDFGAIPVAENDHLVGMLTDRDITIRAVAAGLDPAKTRVRDVMTNKVLYCFEDETISAVANNFGDNQIRRLPVLNRQKRLVGILSLGDLAQAEPESGERPLQRISKRSHLHSEMRP